MAKKIGICIPTNLQQTYTEFWMQVCRIQAHAFKAGYDVEIYRGDGYTPAECHDMAIEQAMMDGAEAVLIMGTDEIHPTNIIPWFDSQPADIIVPLVYMRREPYSTVLFHAIQDQPDGKDTKPISLFAAMANAPESDDPLFQVDAAGSGGMFIRRAVLEKIPMPWFQDLVDFRIKHPFTYRLLGHDIVFCIKAKTHGFKVYCDLRCRSAHLSLFAIDDNFRNRLNGGLWAPDPNVRKTNVDDCKDEEAAG